MSKYAALFVRADSEYKERENCDAWDAERNAVKYRGGLPVVCHPPCRKWGILAHMAHNATPWEKHYAHWSVAMIRRNGGVLEHPASSKVFGYLVPDVGEMPDEWGGFTILIDQFDFGHVAHKNTKLYICGAKELPPLPPKRIEETDRSICGNKWYQHTGRVHGMTVKFKRKTTRCTTKQREYTPTALIEWIEKLINTFDNPEN